jgi:hypothetical protein
MRQIWYKTEFVKSIPPALMDGVLYVSIEYRVAMHRCMCGCGSEISTPISKKNGWTILYDGDNTTLSPSIGNGAYICRSHYFLREGKVMWLDNIGTVIAKPKKKATWFERLFGAKV